MEISYLKIKMRAKIKVRVRIKTRTKMNNKIQLFQILSLMEINRNQKISLIFKKLYRQLSVSSRMLMNLIKSFKIFQMRIKIRMMMISDLSGFL
jgi:hypothetical protein